ncbi:MAG: DUF4403 family protein [Nitrospiraceae bacterium]
MTLATVRSSGSPFVLGATLACTVAFTSAVSAAERAHRTEPSTLRIQMPVPLAVIQPLYERIYDGHDSNHLSPDTWIPLGGGTGFLKYRPGLVESNLNQNSHAILARANVNFSLEYAKKVDGTITKLAECGAGAEPDRPGRLVVNTYTTLTPTRDYRLLTTSHVRSVDSGKSWVRRQHNVDATPLMAQVYRSGLESRLPQLDRRLQGALSIKSKTAEVWRKLQEPLQLDDQGFIWLLVSPAHVKYPKTPPKDAARPVQIGIIAFPRIITGNKPTTSLRSLPDLESGYQDQGFHVSFDVHLRYEVANEFLRGALVGKEFHVGPGTLRIRSVRLYPIGEQAGVDLELQGFLPVRLSLRGTPLYDEEAGTISFTNFDYQVKQHDLLTTFADQMLHDAFRNQLVRRLRIPIRDHLQQMQQELQTGLNREIDGGTLHGTVHRLRLLRLQIQHDALLAGFKTDGELRYDLRD